MKRFFKILFVVVLILLALLIFLPMVFQSKIEETAKTELNKAVAAKIDFKDVKLSLISSFPDFKFEINDLSVVGVGDFENDTLAFIHKLQLKLDLFSVFGGDEFAIKSIVVDDPLVFVKILKDGKANYDIALPSDEVELADTTASSGGMVIKLKDFQINRGHIVYDDYSYDMLMVIQGLDMQFEGDLTEASTKLDLVTKIASFDFDYEGMRYMNSAAVDFKGIIDANLETFVFNFLENELLINQFPIKFTGMFGMPGNDYDLDLAFSSPKTDFKHLLSLIPALYMNDFKDMKTIGEMSFKGTVKGIYNDNLIPGFNINLLVDKALFKYPDLPRSAENISIDLQLTNPGGDPDFTEIWLKKFHVDLGTNPVDMTFKIKNPVSDMHINGQVDAKVDFAGMTDIVPMEGYTMKGMLDASLKMLGNMSAIEEERYSDFAASGRLDLDGFEMSSPDFPAPLVISKAAMSFSPASIDLSQFDARLGSSNFQLSGKFENYISYVFKDETLIGSLDLKSTLINLNELMGIEESPETTTAEESTPMEVVEIPKNIDFTFTAAIEKLIYDKLLIDQMNGMITMKDGRMSMDKLGMDMLGGNMLLTGYYDSKDITKPEVDFQMKITDIAIDKSYETFQTIEKLTPLAKNCRGNISADIKLKSLLDQQMNPVMSSINSSGSLSSKQISIVDSKAFKTLGDKLKMEKLSEPSLNDFKASYEMKDGILEVKPFVAKVAGQKATISGTQGIDRSIDYKMALDIPTASFAGSLNSVFPGQVMGDFMNVNVLFTGSLDDPKVGVGLGSDNKSLVGAAKDKVKEEVGKKVDEAKEKVNEEIQKKKEKILKDAQQKADAMKEAARKSAEKIRAEADKKAKELTDAAKNKNAIEKKLAQTAAEKLRKEADEKAKKVVSEADKQADEIMKKAKEEADKVVV
ncbi:MAG: hypothetical protein K9H64_04490 [Bacteroidales bacterium]|nr:hypothetical protein [Bacteroidales bacterium]MCF8455138.1 hypothetical protein [Bacteroidales bacterium]